MIGWIRKKFGRRNYAISDMHLARMGQPVFTDWTIRKAVKDGYKASGWAYRAVYLISKCVASVPWAVYADGEQVPGHPLAELIRRPNPHISRQDMFELMTCWLELAGNSYLYRVQAGGRTAELWPVSPDRLKPIPGTSVAEWCRGYALDQATRPTFGPEEIIHHRFLDPANPLIGISPLQVAGRAVDTDVAQQKFNSATSQSRGVVDGVFTFDREFSTQDDADAVAEKIEEKYGKKRGFLVLGKNAKYQRIAMSPTEMDFTDSRKFNREEICVIFGVPLPLISQDKTTYNNYQTAEEILWTLTIIPLLDDLADGFCHSFDDDLAAGQVLRPDLSRVPAVRRMLLSRAGTAEKLSGMGVPFEQINRIFEFGVEEYPGWDQSVVRTQTTDVASDPAQKRGEKRRMRFRLAEKRTAQADMAASLDRLSEGEIGPIFEKLLSKQKITIFGALDNGITSGLESHVLNTRDDWEATLRSVYLDVAIRYGEKVVVETREIIDPLTKDLEEYFDHEYFLLTELGHIEATTVTTLIAQVKDGLAAGATTAEIQQAVIDTGIFEPARALRLARTVSGSAASIGQYTSAKMSGATHKTWMAGGGARKQHAQRDGETVGINERFTPKFGMSVGPRWPLDPYLVPADRVNCRCCMSFSIREG